MCERRADRREKFGREGMESFFAKLMHWQRCVINLVRHSIDSS
jgi:hypothetical protein